VQFYVTDSINHFLSGALYFSSQPNYDSILPAIDYLRSDVRKLLETLRWKTVE
jgi:gliding motility-associated lipoprotein GldD